MISGDGAEHPAIIKTLILPGGDWSGNPNTWCQIGFVFRILDAVG
jgi:hypothetical protein